VYVSACVCMLVCVCVYIYIYICVCVSVCVFVCMRADNQILKQGKRKKTEQNNFSAMRSLSIDVYHCLKVCVMCVCV